MSAFDRKKKKKNSLNKIKSINRKYRIIISRAKHWQKKEKKEKKKTLAFQSVSMVMPISPSNDPTTLAILYRSNYLQLKVRQLWGRRLGFVRDGPTNLESWNDSLDASCKHPSQQRQSQSNGHGSLFFSFFPTNCFNWF